MKICVVGLGLIGGSVCLSLRRAGMTADGSDRNENAVDYAIKRGIIGREAKDLGEYDLLIVALPPDATKRFLRNAPVKDGAIVMDVCGVKKPLEEAYLSSKRNFRYVGTHPMAGRESSGIENACEELFDGASLVVTKNEKTDQAAFDTVAKLAKRMGFSRIVECSAKVHDRKIAYTSQLAHVVSNCYVNDEEIEGCFGFTGGSFQDMTRIAGVDESMWASLYLENADNLEEKVKRLYNCLGGFLGALKEAKASGDEGTLREFLRTGAETFRAGRDCKFVGGEIKVTEL